MKPERSSSSAFASSLLLPPLPLLPLLLLLLTAPGPRPAGSFVAPPFVHVPFVPTTSARAAAEAVGAAPSASASSAAGRVRMDTEGGSDERAILLRGGRAGGGPIRRVRDALSSGPLASGGPGPGARRRRRLLRRPDGYANERRVRRAERMHGMPWRDSAGEYAPPEFDLPMPPPPPGAADRVVGLDDGEGDASGAPPPSSSGSASLASPLLYMPFWEWQMNFMKSELTNLRPASTVTACGTFDVGYMENTNKRARVVNHCYSSDEYRKIRMTYYDAGDTAQVFNSLWYPHPRYDLPVLGVDLLAFGRKRYLTVVDFQPGHMSESDHAVPYEETLRPIRDSYPSLRGNMTDRFYDSSRHFSSQMLFGRLEDESTIRDEVWPAYREYVRAHVDMVRRCPPDDTEGGMGRALAGQGLYDTYSAERDPAHALFGRMFGEEWADAYVHGFLFDLSEKGRGGGGADGGVGNL